MRLRTSQLTLHKLEVFCAVVELASVSRAAERLGLAQPVVTAHMRSIHDKIGVRLIARSGRNIAVTDEGRRVYRWAREVISRTRELERELSAGAGPTGGRIAIAASLTVGSHVLPPRLAALRKAHPEIDVALKVTAPGECIAAVRDGACDLAMTLLDPGRNTGGLDVEPLWEERLLLIAAAQSAHVGASVPIGAVADLPFVAPERDSPRRDIEEAALRAYGIVRRRIEIEIGQSEGMKEAVMSDAGVAFLFEASIVREVAAGSLRIVATEGMALAAPVYLVVRRAKSFSPVQQTALAFLLESLRR